MADSWQVQVESLEDEPQVSSYYTCNLCLRLKSKSPDRCTIISEVVILQSTRTSQPLPDLRLYHSPSPPICVGRFNISNSEQRHFETRSAPINTRTNGANRLFVPCLPSSLVDGQPERQTERVEGKDETEQMQMIQQRERKKPARGEEKQRNESI